MTGARFKSVLGSLPLFIGRFEHAEGAAEMAVE